MTRKWAVPYSPKDIFLNEISLMRWAGYTRDEIAAAIRFTRKNRKAAEMLYELGREYERDNYRGW